MILRIEVNLKALSSITVILAVSGVIVILALSSVVIVILATVLVEAVFNHEVMHLIIHDLSLGILTSIR